MRLVRSSMFELDALALRQRDPLLALLADHHDVRQARREGDARRVLHVDDLVRARVLLTRPVLLPPLIMQIAPISNLHLFSIFPVSKFTRTVSLAFTSGSGNRMVRPS